jgi:hypothetical protein
MIRATFLLLIHVTTLSLVMAREIARDGVWQWSNAQ